MSITAENEDEKVRVEGGKNLIFNFMHKCCCPFDTSDVK